VYRLEFARDVAKDLRKISQPLSLSRNRKILINLVPPWDVAPPVWELRVGQYRVFYDVDEGKKVVYVRAVREKPRGKTTEEIL
jgi:mRNA-degrading endonuclease RelE of RelBE toxin-antitoxin system